jgi:prepilin-type N-terminal cleavage/methylation domain-containing protein
MRPSASYNSKHTRSPNHRGFSLIELLIVVAIILIIAAIAIPSMLKSKMDANQAAAVANLRTISTASVSYWVTYSNGYPPSIGALGGSNGNPATCNLAILIDEVIASAPNQKSGYQFAYAGDQGNVASVPPGCTPGYVGYLATATPLSIGLTGNNSYCTDEPGVLHYDTTGAAAASAATCDALPVIQ